MCNGAGIQAGNLAPQQDQFAFTAAISCADADLGYADADAGVRSSCSCRCTGHTCIWTLPVIGCLGRQLPCTRKNLLMHTNLSKLAVAGGVVCPAIMYQKLEVGRHL